MRKAAIQRMKSGPVQPYPHKFHVTLSICDYIEKYSFLEPGQHLDDVEVSISGGHWFHFRSYYMLFA